FVFQAEDGIRHFHVTGVQTCALPIFSNVEQEGPAAEAGIRSGDVIIKFDGKDIKHMTDLPRIVGATKPGTRVDMDVWRKGKAVRSEERRVGKECRGGWWVYQFKRN